MLRSNKKPFFIYHGIFFTLFCYECLLLSHPGSITCSATTCGTSYNPTSGTVDVCPGGTYYNNSLCEDCPAGFKCAGFDNAPVACNDGTYQDQSNQQTCLVCPAGKSCTVASDTPVNCGTGKYSPEGDSECHVCPMGTYTTSTTADVCQQCSRGSYCENGAMTGCLPGTYTSTIGQSNCVQCPSGYHTSGNSNQEICTPCDAGYDCTNAALSPTKCTAGQYSVYAEGICRECPAGYECSSGTPMQCPDGQYADTAATRTTCTSCPAGKSCLDPSAVPVDCNAGYYSGQDDVTCTICPAGSSCTESTASECTDGSYSLTGVGTCTVCPSGYYCPNKDQLPIICPVGETTSGNTGQTECVKCPAGQSCSGSGNFTSCGTGEYTPPGSLDCEQCPAGYSCSDSSATACTAGWYSEEGASTCTECSAGFACSDQTRPNAETCDSGYYSEAGATTCTLCEPGKQCSSTDGSSNTACAKGDYSFGGKTACTVCQAGNACPNKDGSGNTQCSPGEYSEAQAIECTDCPAGSQCPNTNSAPTGSDACLSGTYSTGKQQYCTPCPAGYKCTTNDVAPTEQCIAGSYSILGDASCKECTAGFYCPQITSDVEIQCLPGYYAVAGQTSCTICPAGKECPDTTKAGTECANGFYSLEGEAHCTPCPAGYECSDEAKEPVICNAGTFSGPQSFTVPCTDCDAGYICEAGSNSPQQTICPIGYYCEAPSVAAVPCPAGTYGNKEGLKAQDECTDCPAGYFCIEATTGPLTNANLCPLGHYCPVGTQSALVNKCDAGTYNDELGAAAVGDCKQCSAGHNCVAGSQYDDIPCPAGSYCPAGIPMSCPNGTYTVSPGGRSKSDCVRCPPGSYCEEGVDSPVACPVGKFDNTGGQVSENDCEPCIAGFACTSTGLTQPNSPCDMGHYCPSGSSLPNANPCSEGKYTDLRNATSDDECTICPERYYCPSGTGGDTRPSYCIPGYYCTPGRAPPSTIPISKRPIACPAGTWSNKSLLATADECSDCPPSYYCIEASTTPGTICPQGNYCPQNTEYAIQHPCHSGTYSNKTGNQKYQDCDDCPEGYYCPQQSINPTPCPAGTYNPNTNEASETNACETCTAGMYCPYNGTVEEIPCPVGFYSASGAPECTECEAGYYCDEPGTSENIMKTLKICPAGMFCLAGRTTAPNLKDDYCPAGFYCLTGDVEPTPQPCQIGTYNSETGRINNTFCIGCLEGYYCDEENLTEPAGPCPPGYYCPTGTGDSRTYPCPPGTYLNGFAAIEATNCVSCTSGYYCPNYGTSYPTICPAGQYCDYGSTIPELCPAGTYSNSTGIKTDKGCTDCTGGTYCDGTGNLEPDGDCKEGYFCRSGAYTATPDDGTTGDLCTAGGYCPTGSSTPLPCPPGTYTPNEGAANEDNCTDCPPGKFCSGANAAGITGPCAAGYYCTGGAQNATQYSAEAGYYTEEGFTHQNACVPGTYSPKPRSVICSPCPAGQYCNRTAMIEGDLCPLGAYCKLGSPLPSYCPTGTYNDVEGKSLLSDCKICKAGSYCTQNGLPEPEGECLAGYYCKEGSSEQSPEEETDTGGPCPAGYYCIEGTSTPKACGSGKYLNVTKGSSKSDCKFCPPGLTCPNQGSVYPTGLCAEKYYCTEGADAANGIPDLTSGSDNWGHECPIGYKCPVGSGYPTPCEPGYYQPNKLQKDCNPCEEGFQCIGYNNKTDCPKGHYCPKYTGLEPPQCPIGTFKSITGGSDISACEPCLAGYYCDEFALELPTKECDPGYYCLTGVDVPDPGTATTNGTGGICPVGHYCQKGTGEPESCPSGTYLNSTRNSVESDCVSCEGGKYCRYEGKSTWTGDCDAGYFCTSGSATPKPTTDGIGNVCPVGHYCPVGTKVPNECQSGFYANSEKAIECTPCQAGYYCPNKTSDFTDYECTLGNFCPPGSTAPTPCPAGTYGSAVKLESSDDCEPCDPGKYCLGGDFTFSGDCEAGYFCLGNSSTATPSSTADSCACSANTNGICPTGYICPQGTSTPQPCPAGFYCPNDQMGSTNLSCDPGFYCKEAATVFNPTDGVTGDVCPPGYFCEEGSGSPTACDVGTFSNKTQQTSQNDCLQCTPGYACEKAGLTEPDQICEAGFYCSLGSSSKVSQECEAGYQCPEGSGEVIRCEQGFYQPKTQQSSCIICPKGYYCDYNDIVIDYTLYKCPLGYYCPEGTKSQYEYGCLEGTYGASEMLESAGNCTLCPVGKYCSTQGLSDPTNLPDCEAGFYCILGSNSSTPDDGITGKPCPQGFYCLEGTTNPEGCNKGTFNNRTGLTSASKCSACTPGYYCDGVGLIIPTKECDERYYCPGGNTKPSSPLYNCTIGSYCPKGTPNPFPCDEGKYNTQPLQFECQNCPAGSYCVNGIDLLPCPEGFYCPEQTGYNWTACPLGTFSNSVGLMSDGDCTKCTAGNYCNEPNATSATGECNARFYCGNGSTTPTPIGSEDSDNRECGRGYFCPSGTTTEQQCPVGSFSNATGLADATECEICSPGYYCLSGSTEPTGPCAGGYYCKEGAKKEKVTPTDSTGGQCPKGYYCPLGTADPKGCLPGTYNDLAGQENCTSCPLGYFCPENTTDYSTNECPSGHYCPFGTKDQFEYPCPAGTYNPELKKGTLRDCLPCPPGKYCENSGNTAFTGECDAGWYCTSCAWSAKPVDPGIMLDINETSCLCPVLDNITRTGGQCPMGTFCPRNSSEPTICTPGFFCDEVGLSFEAGECDPGYFCANGSASNQPTDGITGDKCPAGSYCPENTAVPRPCDPGTYSPNEYNTNKSQCINCTAGSYCGGGSATVTGDCDPGFYCPEGQSVAAPMEFVCPIGHFCDGGNDMPKPCVNGTYQSLIQQANCTICTEGYYCESVTGCNVNGISAPEPCLMGYYCPLGTAYSTQYGCEEGTYGNTTNLNSADECIKCDGGKFCAGMSLIKPTGNCKEGYFCTQSAIIENPTDGITGNICPEGSYCIEGSSSPEACPKGTFGPTEGLVSKESCTSCTAGKYCESPGFTNVTGDCEAGYYCPEGSTSSKAEPCPVGYYCPEGSGNPLPCSNGTYTYTPQQSECITCTAGKMCNGTLIQDCPRGYYCPEGTGDLPYPCLRGTYGPTLSLKSESECTPCDGGYYCNTPPQTTTSGECEAGYYCRSGSDKEKPTGDNTGDAGICPSGSYCPKNTSDPIACSEGTYNNATMAVSVNECLPCSAGQACASTGLSFPSGPCSAGYYCVNGSASDAPSTTTENGGPCTKGHYCEVGSSLQKPCAGGSYAPSDLMSSCDTCPEGAYCGPGAFVALPCTVGHYCELGSESPKPCTNGTYNNETGSSSLNACQLCPAGMYCPNQGMENPAGKCSPGWYCILGSWMKEPVSVGRSPSPGDCTCQANGGIGGQCGLGEYCPEGSSYPEPCDSGYYCDEIGLFSVKGPCQEGYYCTLGSQNIAPINETYGDVCPCGSYCPQGSAAPVACGNGTYSRNVGNTNDTNCQECDGGLYCPSPGICDPDIYICSAGYYCVPGSTEKEPISGICPKGAECPENSAIYKPCYSGTYQDQTQKSACFVCPEGWYCNYDEAVALGDVGVVNPIICPKGFWCPAGTKSAIEHPCLPGTYNDEQERGDIGCKSCTAGHYCDQTNLTNPTGQCFAGYYCPSSSASPTERDCPQGYYCEIGTGNYVDSPCTMGTYGNSSNLGTLMECADCDPGKYCDTDGLSSPTGDCLEGYYCTSGSQERNPDNTSYGDICPTGHYCPTGSDSPKACFSGTYNPQEGQPSVASCQLCPTAQYCNGTGLAQPTGNCLSGYYCDGGSNNETQHICPPGSYCVAGQITACENGSYSNFTGAQQCEICPEGFYCINRDRADPCPPKYYCPYGTGANLQKCPKGTFNPGFGLSSEEECTLCSAGRYCADEGLDQPSGYCDDGFECVIGVNTNRPDNSTNTGVGGTCNVGYECKNGSSMPCAAGSYSNTPQTSECTPCDAGYYCDGATENPVICPSGHYCPLGTASATEYACLAGTFNPEQGQSSSASCLPCLSGEYCQGDGNGGTTGECDPGFFCKSNAETKTPIATGQEGIVAGSPGGPSNITCDGFSGCSCPNLDTSNYGICTPGFYCPVKSATPIACTAGNYCPNYGMDSPQGRCNPGYYCEEGSALEDQYQCPPGYYCPNGSRVACEPGTFSPSYGNVNQDDCQSCTPGYVCDGYHNLNVTAKCPAGKYCSGGSTSDTASTCDENHRCPEGSVSQIVCEPSTYQPSTGATACTDCLAGFECDPYDGNQDPEPCPAGYYCESGKNPEPCPLGTYSNTISIPTVASCLDCPAGSYCGELASTNTTGDCEAGFYCSGKASSKNAEQDPGIGITADCTDYGGNNICPVGHYCDQGSPCPTPCPPGTYANVTGKDGELACDDCPAGKYCESEGLVDGRLAPDCAEGYVCYGKSIAAEPTDGVTGEPCPSGFYCPAGTPIPQPCLTGHYTPTTQFASCLNCPAGSYCPYSNTSLPLSCPKGKYCKIETSIPENCPVGTYRSTTGAQSIDECFPCAGGKYCDTPGLEEVAGNCSSGYICQQGSVVAEPDTGFDALTGMYNGPCFAGQYCPEMTEGPTGILCTVGTYRNNTMGKEKADCFPCKPGYYCDEDGLTEPTAECNPGYYCPGTSPNSNPNQNPCDIGYYCPKGSSQQLACPTGQYQPNTAQANCQQCEQGYYCQESITGNKTECPPYFYCPAGTQAPIPCPNGTYTKSDEVMLGSEDDCTPCPTGKYCNGGRLLGNCSEGYFCLSRAYSPTTDDSTLVNVDQTACPALTTCASQCPAGHYCPEGSDDPFACPENTLRETPGASQVSECAVCPQGAWCHPGDPIAEPCPAGHYCPGLNNSDCGDGAPGPQECPLFTYKNDTGGVTSDDCYACPAGYWCNETGLTIYSNSACQLGYYCTGGGQAPQLCPAGTLRNVVGAGTVNDCSPCTPGYYCPNPTEDEPNINGIPCSAGYECPAGSVNETICRPGYYCGPKTGDPTICPAGYSCPPGSTTYQVCVYPYYCPEGTGYPLPCNIGYQPLNISGLRDDQATACMICPSGTYRNSSDDDACQTCPRGYFCPEGTGNYQQNPCPDGHECPAGSSSAKPCPAGTYGAKEDGSEFSVCISCPVHTFNNLLAQSACKQCGSSSDSEEGASTCICTGENRAFQESDGYCVCKSGYTYYNLFNVQDPSANSPESCQAVVSPRCSGVRNADDGTCASANDDCIGTCDTRGGTIDPTFGICICSQTTIPQEIECFSCVTVVTYINQTTGVYTMTSTDDTTGTSQTETVSNILGPQASFTQTSQTFFVEFTPSGIFGVGSDSFSTVNDYLDGTLQSSTIADTDPVVSSRKRRNIDEEDTNSYFGRRLLQSTVPTATANSSQLPIIPNPVLCLQLNEIVLFSIAVDADDRTLSDYPVYISNHLLNTNPNFDYGDFRLLAQYVTTTNLTIDKFAHAFIDEGVYVFGDSQNINQELIISVYPDSLVCPAYRINPASEQSLTAVGVVQQTPTNLEPDWPLIIALICLFGIIVLILLIVIFIWRSHDLGIYPMKLWMPQYRSLGQTYIPPHKMPIDYRAVRNRGEAEGAEAIVTKDEQLLEDFNVKTLYDKLEDQNLHLSSQLAKHQADLNGFYERISNQTEGLKKMLNSLDVSQLEALEKMRTTAEDSLHDGPTVVNANMQMNGIQREIKLSGGSSIREKELLFSVHQLIDNLNKGKVPISDNMLNEARERWKKGNMDVQASKTISQLVNAQSGAAGDDFKAQGQTELIRAQHLERMDLEKEILAEEKDKLDDFIQLRDEQKTKTMKDISDQLAFKLQGELTEKEVNEILAAHEKDLEEALDKMAAERQRQMYELKQQLALKRKKREQNLKDVHHKQCNEADIPTDIKDEEEDNDNLDNTQLELEAANAEQHVESLRESGDSDSKMHGDERQQLSRTVDDALDSLLANGLISEEVREMMRKQKLDRETALQERMNKKRDAQLAAMKKRMNERRRRKIKDLEDKHKNEQEKAGGLTPEMQFRQAAEMAALVAELDAEDAQMEHNIINTTNEEHKSGLEDLHRNIIDELTKKHALDPLTQQELLDKYRRDAENFEHLMNIKKTQNAQDLKARLAARKARKAAEALRNAQDRAKNKLKNNESQQLEDLKKHHEELANQEEDDGIFVPEITPEDNYEQKALEKEQQSLLVELDEQQIEEAERLNGELENQEKEEEDELEKKLQEEKDMMIREKKNKQEAEARARTDLSDEQLQQLMAAHSQELEDLERKANVEHNRQRAALREKLMARKNRKTNALKKRQQLDKEKEVVEQKKELQQVAAKTMKDAERKVMIEAIEQNGAAASERVIQKVLEKRQREEIKQLEEEYSLKKKMMLEEKLAALKEQYNALRESLLAKHKTELDNLKENGLTGEEYEKAKQEMLEKQELELNDLDKDHKSQLKQAEVSTSSACDLEFTQQKLKLKEKHYQEFADALRDLAPSSGQQLSAEQAEEASRKLEETRERLEKEQKQAEAKLNEEWEELEAKQKKLIADQMAEFEKQLEEEAVKDKQKAEQFAKKQAQKKEKMIEAKREQMNAEVEKAVAAGASEDEQKKIIDQYEKDVEKIVNKMESEKLRVKSQLEERLKKRRNKKIKNKNEELKEKSDQMKTEFQEKQHQQMEEMHAKQAQAIEETNAAMEVLSRASTPMSGRRSISRASSIILQPPIIMEQQLDMNAVVMNMQQQNLQMQAPSYAMAAPMSDEELNALLLASPLYQTLQDIKEVLVFGKNKKNPNDDAFSGPDLNTSDAELIPTALSALNARDLIVYKFGCFVIKLLHTHCNFPNVSLLVAEKIPKRNDLINNSFNGSFWFDEGNAILYVRLARLKQDSVGKFILLLLHTVAHIHAGDLADDQNVKFTSALYTGLAAICDDLFFFRYKGSNAKEVNYATSGDLLPANGFNEDLIDIRIPGANRRGAPPGQQDFLKTAVEERMGKYSEITASSQFRNELDSFSRSAGDGTQNEVDKRLEQLLPGSAKKQTTSRPTSPEDAKDSLMEEFVQLNRAASSIRETMSHGALSPEEKLKMENQLNNTEIKLSEIQGKIEHM